MIELLNCDCYEKLLSMPDGSVDLFLQDTPFGVTQNEWDIVPDLDKMWPEWLRVGKENAAFIFFATQPFASDVINSMRQYFRYDIIWYKALGTGFLNANKMPMRNHESILVFYRKLPTYNAQMSIGKMKVKGRIRSKERAGNTNYNGFKDLPSLVNNTYHPESVIDFTNGDRTTESDHPTQKPVGLFRYLIKTYSNDADLVFDGYGGSGTTAIAAHMEHRNAIVCELNEQYYNDATRRYSNETAQLKLL
jgi:site-specific DNA-methyltransferase (adenine-specific)